jgi:hypothetical protein
LDENIITALFMDENITTAHFVDENFIIHLIFISNISLMTKMAADRHDITKK